MLRDFLILQPTFVSEGLHALPKNRIALDDTRFVALAGDVGQRGAARVTTADSLRSVGAAGAGLTAAEARARLARDGPNEVPEKPSQPIAQFARKFWGLSAWMIELIAILSVVLHKYTDVAVALALLLVNAVLSYIQEQHASAAVAALRHRLQVTSRVFRDGVWRPLPARELVQGDVIRIRTGDFVPADVHLLDGEVHVDQSALTGESTELGRTVKDTLYSGSIIRQGEATGVVDATGVKTYFGRTTELVQTAHPKLHIEEVTGRMVRWLLVIVGVQVAIALVLSVARGVRILDILPLSLVLLMSAVPVALPVMFTVSMALGAIALAKRGVLVTRLSAAEDAATMDVLCADKTGTLTANRLSLAGTLPAPGFSDDDVVRIGAWASHEADQDPIDIAFLLAAHDRHLLQPTDAVRSFTPFSAATRRTEAIVDTAGGTVRAMKGALRSIATQLGMPDAAVAALEGRANAMAAQGMRVLAVARGEHDEPMTLAGLALLRDAPRPDSRQLISELQSLGVTVKMLTGDAMPVARAVARELGLGEIVRAPDLRSGVTADLLDVGGFAEVFPEDKFLIVKRLQAAEHIVGMTGDGVNDAPALRQAEVGIAVSGSTDVAKGAASVVLSGEGLRNIVDLVKNGRAIYQRVLTWIINKVSRTILKSGFVVIAFLVSGKFVISALGMVLLVFMTDFAKVSLSTDRVRPSQKPETWNIGPLVTIAVVMGLLMLAESLGLLAIVWHRYDLARSDARLATFSFLTLLFFALFSILSIRERRAFWLSRPSTTLLASLAADGGIGLLIGLHGLAALRPLPPNQVALIVGYALVCSLFLNDVVKTVLAARMLHAHPALSIPTLPAS